MLHSNTFCQTVILIVKSRSGLTRRFLLLALIAMLTACGQRGPLYLPDAQMPRGKAAKQTKGVPTLPPAKADTAPNDKTPDNGESRAIVPVTPSIPN
jgi:predicted small lipoprotein YifL